MTQGLTLKLVDDAEASRLSPAKVFVKTVITPPGLPWDQARAAALEARIGAPLPLDQVLFRLKRLEPWKLGQAARYAVGYLRKSDAGEAFNADVIVDGKARQIRFRSAAETENQRKQLATIMFAGTLVLAATAGGIGSALIVREKAEARLAAVEQASLGKLRAAKKESRLKAQARILDAAKRREATVGDMLNDLSWASLHRAQGVRVEAFHWDRRYIAVEVRGQVPPFANSERTLTKAPQPLRRGVWLWGVAPPVRTEAE